MKDEDRTAFDAAWERKKKEGEGSAMTIEIKTNQSESIGNKEMFDLAEQIKIRFGHAGWTAKIGAVVLEGKGRRLSIDCNRKEMAS